MDEGLDFDDTTISVGALRECIDGKHKKRKISFPPLPAQGGAGGTDGSDSSPPPAAGGKRGRQVVWHPRAGQYLCIRAGDLIVQNIRDLDTLSPVESNFYIFRNTDANATRNANVPLYEAAYKCADGTLVRVQKKHLKMAYTLCGRKDVSKAWSLLPPQGDIPYWVDRFAFCRVKN